MTAKLSRDEIAFNYEAILNEISVRLDAIQESLLEAIENSDNHENWKNADFCYLQARKICELLSLGILVTHSEYEGFSTKQLTKEYNAHEIVSRAIKLNENGCPIAAQVKFDFHGPGLHHVETDTTVMSPNCLSKLYHVCGNQLHVGSLRKLVNGTRPTLDFGELIHWNNKLTKLLSMHMILLPEIRSVMLAVLKDETSLKSSCKFAEADGPSELKRGFNYLNFEISETT